MKRAAADPEVPQAEKEEKGDGAAEAEEPAAPAPAGSIEPPSKTGTEGRMGACEVCKTAAAKYRCPGCGVTFCSVACSKAHKAASGCSGKRDRTAFVGLGDITDTVLASDYMLLEDSRRRKDAGYRTLGNITTTRHTPAALFVVVSVQILVLEMGMCCDSRVWQQKAG